MERYGITTAVLAVLTVLLLFCAFPADEAGASWKENGIPICTARGDQVGVEACPDGSGGAIIAWYNGGVSAQRVDASGIVMWKVNGVSVSRAPGSQVPGLVEDGSGGAIVTWDDLRSGANPDIYAQRLDADGRMMWAEEGVPVAATTCSERCRDIAVDGSGGAIITWCDDRRAGDCDVYAQRLDSSGRPLWTVDGVRICSAAGAQEFPRVVSDGAGGAVVTWADFRDGREFHIYAQRVDGSGRPVWQEDGVPICTAPGSKLPRIAPDGAGGAVIAWRDPRKSSNYDIYAQRVNDSGKILWGLDGVAVCTVAGAKWWPLVVSDAAGGAIVLWRDYRDGTSYDTYAQRVGPSGKALWKKNGVLVSGGEYNERYHDLVPDGAGGAIVSWYEEHLSGTYDIYAQRVSPQGRQQWRAGGVIVCAAPEDQQFPVAAPDGSGGAILAWTDFRNGTDYDVYAQRVGSSGGTGSAGRGSAGSGKRAR